MTNINLDKEKPQNIRIRSRPKPPIVEDNYSLDELVGLLKTELDLNSDLSTATVSASTAGTFTVTQVLAGVFALLSIVGSLVMTWTSLNNQITTLKVSTDLLFAQLAKDQSESNIATNEFRVKVDQNLKEIANKVDSLDTTISQIYLSNAKSKNK